MALRGLTAFLPPPSPAAARFQNPLPLSLERPPFDAATAATVFCCLFISGFHHRQKKKSGETSHTSRRETGEQEKTKAKENEKNRVKRKTYKSARKVRFCSFISFSRRANKKRKNTGVSE